MTFSVHEQFHIPKDILYYNCAYMSPQAKHVTEAGDVGLEKKKNPWDVFPNHFYEESDEVRALFAQLVNASADDIALIPAVSYGVGIAAANLPIPSGGRVLVLEDQFPSNYYPWLESARMAGGELVVVKRPADHNWTNAVLAEIDNRTTVAALPHCHWTDGSLVDLVAVGEALRKVGAALVVDATQSLGAFPFDVNAIKPDFLITAGYKWMLGPYSTGFLYVAPQHRQGRPLEYNWITRKDSQDFARLVDYTDQLSHTATRFDVGERSNFMLMPMTKASLELLNAWNPAEIAKTMGAYNQKLIEGAAELGLNTLPNHLRAPHLLGLRAKNGLPSGLAPGLKERNIFVSVRGDAIRVSPYLYNTDDDCLRFLDALKALL